MVKEICRVINEIYVPVEFQKLKETLHGLRVVCLVYHSIQLHVAKYGQRNWTNQLCIP